MRIKRLDIMGFKSFPERVQVPFSPGISAVVGPNGCGKSNIVDAIRWVMGEQSAKQLRGRQMDDILFNGARTHQPSGLAEVTLVMSNETGPRTGPTLGPAEIAITRRLYRSGDSEYLINKVPCRLKDIIQFFMDTGMGTKAYAVIEQGRIGALVDARPEERRALIDEAAGITRYKAQKKEAERKIEATIHNLTNIESVMAETKRQVSTLTRAANKAIKFKELKGQLKEIELAMAVTELSALDHQRRHLTRRQSELETDLTRILGRLDQVEVDLIRTRLETGDQEKDIETKNAALYQLQSEFKSLEQEDNFLQKQIRELGDRREKLAVELLRFTDQQREQAEELANLQVRLATLKQENAAKIVIRDELRIEHADMKRDYELSVEKRDQIRQDMAQIKSRLVRLEESLAGKDRLAEQQTARQEEILAENEQLQTEMEYWRGQAVELSREKTDVTTRGVAARDEFETAGLEIKRLRSQADNLLTEERSLESRLATLSSRLATLRDVQAQSGWYPEGVQALMAWPEKEAAGIIGPVAERLIVPEGYEAAMEAGLGERLGYVLVQDRQAAVRAIDFLTANRLGRCGLIVGNDIGWPADSDFAGLLLGQVALVDTLVDAVQINSGRNVLTKNGEFVGTNGVIIGGQGQRDVGGLLLRRRELGELESQVAILTETRDQIVRQRQDVLAIAETARQSMTQAEDHRRRADAQLAELDKKLSAIQARSREHERRAGAIVRLLENRLEDARRLAEEKESAQTEIASLAVEAEGLEQELEQATEQVRVTARELEAIVTKSQRASLEVEAIRDRLQTGERELTRISKWLEDVATQISVKTREQEVIGGEIDRLGQRRQVVADLCSGFADRLTRAEDEVNMARRLVDELREATNLLEGQARQGRKQREEVNHQIRKVELDLQEVIFKRQGILERVENEYHLNIDKLPEDSQPKIGPDFDIVEAGPRRDDLRTKIEAMGEVNLTAIGEHEALLERYNFYRDQYDDLTRAINNLQDSIAKINRTCKIKFNSTFKAVDEKLREIFPLLFDGGEAWLSLSDEADPLESGVEIHVHPPGKKLTVMSLLSGGEKALVALALIFALYLIKPSPFCLLDETDAPLDEANIDRFNRLLTKLGQSSQIIMVTHNKRTMQISQTLYGVTMETPGVSKMVSVNLAEAEKLEKHVQMVQAG